MTKEQLKKLTPSEREIWMEIEKLQKEMNAIKATLSPGEKAKLAANLYNDCPKGDD